jgi:hypothetical protein
MKEGRKEIKKRDGRKHGDGDGGRKEGRMEIKEGRKDND